MLVSKMLTPSLIDPTPRLVDPTPSLADPTRASGVWFALGIQDLGLHWAYTFHVVCVHFVCVGIQALGLTRNVHDMSRK